MGCAGGKKWLGLVAYGLIMLLVNMESGKAMAETLRILALGDSLTAGYGLPDHQSFASQLEKALRDGGHDVAIINAGVSGDTTAGGLARLDWALADKPQMAIVELGANDGLRNLDVAEVERNLDAILTKLKAARVPVLLTGMYALDNFGKDYAERFRAIYPRLAQRHNVPLYPFFLEGVVGDKRLNQSDMLHPNAQGVHAIVERIQPQVLRLMEQTRRETKG